MSTKKESHSIVKLAKKNATKKYSEENYRNIRFIMKQDDEGLRIELAELFRIEEDVYKTVKIPMTYHYYKAFNEKMEELNAPALLEELKELSK